MQLQRDLLKRKLDTLNLSGCRPRGRYNLCYLLFSFVGLAGCVNFMVSMYKHRSLGVSTDNCVNANNLDVVVNKLPVGLFRKEKNQHPSADVIEDEDWMKLEDPESTRKPGKLWENKATFSLNTNPDNILDYLITVGNVRCFKEGVKENYAIVGGVCSCRDGWFGSACSIPSIVQRSETPFDKNNLILRKRPRRVIHAFPFNMEFDMLDVKLAELGEVVNAFLILESNYTTAGDAKHLYLLNRLKRGAYPEISDKILHVFLDYFPDGALKDGWIVQGLIQDYIGTHGLKKITDWNLDDLYIMTDADELPSREAVLFLKWHDGYTEPIGFHYSWTVYSFFWRHLEGFHRFYAGITMNMLIYFYHWKPYKIRQGIQYIQQRNEDLILFQKMNGSYGIWVVGAHNFEAGWHCSWCLNPERMRHKLLSAQLSDFPLWKDYPAKPSLAYIRSLIGDGIWFNSNKPRLYRPNPMLVPKFILRNKYKYYYLIYNLYNSDL